MLQHANSKKATRLIWSNLEDTFKSYEFCQALEHLENKYNVSNEEQFFQKLVNTSLSKLQPYHRWVRYREGYAGDLVKEILARYPCVPQGFVLDPMCGSGSTSVAASELGLKSVGLDVNPFAILSNNVKSFVLTDHELNFLHKIIEEWSTKPFVKKHRYNEFENQISKYFDKSNFDDLVKLKRSIKQVKEKRINDILNFCLLAILEDSSNRKRDGNGLATRPSPVSNVKQRFIDQLN